MNKIKKLIKSRKFWGIIGGVLAVVIVLTGVSHSIMQAYTKMFAERLREEYVRWVRAGCPTGTTFDEWIKKKPHTLPIVITNLIIRDNRKVYHGVLAFLPYQLIATREGDIVQVVCKRKVKVIIEGHRVGMPK